MSFFLSAERASLSFLEMLSVYVIRLRTLGDVISFWTSAKNLSRVAMPVVFVTVVCKFADCLFWVIDRGWAFSCCSCLFGFYTELCFQLLS